MQPLSSRSLREDDMYVIFSKQRVPPAFVDAFSNALHQFKQTPAFRAISHKYFRELSTKPPSSRLREPGLARAVPERPPCDGRGRPWSHRFTISGAGL